MLLYLYKPIELKVSIMGRITPAWKLQKELELAQKRETFLRRTDRPVKATVDRRQRTLVGYRSSLIKVGANNPIIRIQASAAAVARFGNETALGLYPSSDELLDTAIDEPKSFKPAMIRGVVGITAPTVATAQGSGRRYIRYAANSTGQAQSSFAAPISKREASVTPLEQRDAASDVATAVAASFNATDNGYGRLWFTAEEYIDTLI